MPSPFPGMDPYLEGPQWESFHFAFVNDIGDALSPVVGEQYVVRPQQRVYVECRSETSRSIVPDASVWPADDESPAEASGAVATATLAPVKVEVAIPEPHQETFLTIRDVQTMDVVTVIELVSPSNKRSGEGRQSYLEKRNAVLRSETHFVEIDLLRGGQRLPFSQPPPASDFYAMVSRAADRPNADAYAWSVRQPLPSIPIPLRGDDPDVLLELQPVFTKRYDRGRYAQTLVYAQPPDLPLSEADAEWAARLLQRLLNANHE